MKQLFGNAFRNAKKIFTEPVVDFHFETLQPFPGTTDPLFDEVTLAPTAEQSQPGNQAAVLNALSRATENYFLVNMAPLLRNVADLRWKIKQIQIRETNANTAILKEINQLSPSILTTVSKAILCKLPFAESMDLSQYYGLSIVPDSEVVGRNATIWSSIGHEKTAMQFYFDDEIVVCQSEAVPAVVTLKPATEFPFEVACDFHLKLIDDIGSRNIHIHKFPTIAGSAANADVQVCGQYVSAQHLVLHWDPVLQCVYVTDRSKHGTYFKDCNKLVDGERCNLLGSGSFKLTNQANAPRFEYWHGEQPSQGTELLPTDVGETLLSFATHRNKSSAASAKMAEGSAMQVPTRPRPLANYLRTANATQLDSPSAPTKKRLLSSAAADTLLVEAQQPLPLAWLQVRNAKQQLKTVAINTLPFCIGREFTGDGFPIDKAYAKVSRIHLRLVEQRGCTFGVNNSSLQRAGQSNLTFGEKGLESNNFVWSPQPKNSNAGWRVLGATRLDEQSIEVRLISATGN